MPNYANAPTIRKTSGGSKLVVGAGGTLEVAEGATVTGLAATAATAGTASEIQAGTVTELRVWSPKVIHDEIARQIAAAAA